MKMTRSLFTFGTLAVALITVSAVPSANAETLYHEGFVINSPTYTAGNWGPFSDFGWSVYAEDGADYSGSAVNPAGAAYDAGAPDGDSYRSAIGSGSTLDFVLISDAPAVEPSQRDATLAFSFQHRDQYNSGDMRFLALVGGTWYVSDSYAANNSGWVEVSNAVESTTWYAWETDLTDGFDNVNISGTGSLLPAGEISSAGIFVNNLGGGDYYRIDDFNIEGTGIPLPPSELLYHEGFVINNPTYLAGNFGPFADLGWSAYAETGADYSASEANPFMAAYDAGSPDGDSYRGAVGSGSTLDFVLISDAPDLVPSQRNGALAFSFQHRDQYNSGDLRLLAQVGGTWFVSGAYAANNSGWVSVSNSVESTTWYAWEADLTDGFDKTGISGAGGVLPTGTVTSVGMFVNNLSGGDYYRIDDFNITGSAIPDDPYALWMFPYTSVLSEGEQQKTADPDNDKLDNLMEYALGGNPTVDDAASIQPVVSFAGNQLEYLYSRRTNHVALELNYYLDLNVSLIGGTWTNDVAAYVETGAAPNGEFETVTNMVSTASDNMKFLRLVVEQAE